MAHIEMEIKTYICDLGIRMEEEDDRDCLCPRWLHTSCESYDDTTYLPYKRDDGTTVIIPHFNQECIHAEEITQYLGIVTNRYEIDDNWVKVGVGKRQRIYECSKISLNGKQVYPKADGRDDDEME